MAAGLDMWTAFVRPESVAMGYGVQVTMDKLAGHLFLLLHMHHAM
jgi:hypothetical protein